MVCIYYLVSFIIHSTILFLTICRSHVLNLILFKCSMCMVMADAGHRIFKLIPVITGVANQEEAKSFWLSSGSWTFLGCIGFDLCDTLTHWHNKKLNAVSRTPYAQPAFVIRCWWIARTYKVEDQDQPPHIFNALWQYTSLWNYSKWCKDKVYIFFWIQVLTVQPY